MTKTSKALKNTARFRIVLLPRGNNMRESVLHCLEERTFPFYYNILYYCWLPIFEGITGEFTLITTHRWPFMTFQAPFFNPLNVSPSMVPKRKMIHGLCWPTKHLNVWLLMQCLCAHSLMDSCSIFRCYMLLFFLRMLNLLCAGIRFRYTKIQWLKPTMFLNKGWNGKSAPITLSTTYEK